MMNSLGIKGLLAASIGMAFSLSAYAGAVTPAVSADLVVAAKFNISSLRTGGSYDRFIIRYRVGSTEQGSQVAALQNVSAAIARAGLKQATLSNNAPRVSYKRKLEIGRAHV